MVHLLDVNVLIALLDQDHAHHHRAWKFFDEQAHSGWATCPLTENGLLRILSHPGYPAGPGSAEIARLWLVNLKQHGGHQFWPDDLSLLDTRRFPSLPPGKHLTDAYLLALAVQRGGKLATLDRGIDSRWVAGATDSIAFL